MLFVIRAFAGKLGARAGLPPAWTVAASRRDLSRGKTRGATGLRRVVVIASASTILAPLAATLATAATTVTTYQYNADGAMTAVTTQVDGGDASIAYLTWDDFVPDEDDPTTGTVYAGNGNLLAIGPNPGSGSSLFTFDSRDRLTSFSGADKSAAYGYHADGLVASSTAADDSGFGFYYSGQRHEQPAPDRHRPMVGAAWSRCAISTMAARKFWSPRVRTWRPPTTPRRTR